LHNEVIRGLNHRILQTTGQSIDLKLTPTHYEMFPDGEVLTHQTESVRDCDVFIIAQPRGDVRHLAQDLEEVRTLIHSVKYVGSAYRVNIVIPYFPFQKQDRESKEREPVSIKRLFNEFYNTGVDNIITVQLHNPYSKYYPRKKVEEISAMGFMMENAGQKLGIDWSDYIFAAPDIGATKFVANLARRVNTEFVIIDKGRDEDREPEVRNIIGADKIKDRKVWIWDDQIASGSTLIKGRKACLAHGALAVSAGAPHAILSKDACIKLPQAGFEHLVVCDTYPLPKDKIFPGLTVLPSAELAVRAMDNVHNAGSITTTLNAVAYH
jgi:ribose-phosphate pyrophosphokinase